jgi:TolB-like protein/Tfp pilus assembly protein PilF
VSFFSELRRRNVIRVAAAYLVTAWLVAQIAELALDSFGAPDWVMKTILLVLLLGVPFVAIFAWAFEMTPEGLKREKDVDRSASITHETGRRINYVIIGVLAVALGISLATGRWSADHSIPVNDTKSAVDEDNKSIAVLPFVNMSDDPDNEYFSDGISEELLNVLVKVEGLRVASRTSSFSFKGKNTPIPDIAEALQVEHVLEGSVRKAGTKVRVTAQLIDVRTDSHLWSETYDRELEDIFAIQDEISAHIVDALKVALGAGATVEPEAKPTENLDAYEDYLKGRYFWQRRGAENIRRSIAYFESATAADPGFARAWSSLAAAHITMPTYSDEPKELHYPLAIQNAETALALDPTLAEAHAVLGDIMRVEMQWRLAEEHYRKAIELEPGNPTGYLWYSEHLQSVGRIHEGMRMAQEAYELDPLNPGTTAMLAGFYAVVGDQETADRFLETSWELGHPGAPYIKLQSLIDRGEFAAAKQFLADNAETFDELDVEWSGLAIAAMQDSTQTEPYVSFLLEHVDEVSWHQLVLDYAQLGMLDEAFDLVNQGTSDGSDWGDFWYAPAAFRQDARFAELATSAGLVEYWDEFGWSPFCERQNGGVTCN